MQVATKRLRKRSPRQPFKAVPTTLSKTATALSDRATTLSKTGVDGTVIDIFQRGGEVIPTGECTVVGPTGWWEVLRTDGSESGWVSSKFLSPEPLTDVGNPEFNPGRGKDSPAPEFIGVSAPTLDDLVSELASQFGFDSDVVITPVGEPTGNDATSGTARYDLTGFKDDSLDGLSPLARLLHQPGRSQRWCCS